MNRRRWIGLGLALGAVALGMWLARERVVPVLVRMDAVETGVPREFLRVPPHSPQRARDVERDSPCYRAFERFYAKETIDIRVVFGYKDARPARYVGDRYERLMFISYLLAPCEAPLHACDFRRKPDDPDLFLKDILGPDGAPRHVRLRVVHSSVGPDDDENRQDSFQKWQSDYAANQFSDGLKEADAVFYNGHSRDGGGPDFWPPRLTRRGHVHYGWYQANQPGVALLLGSLKGAGADLLGLFSCVSTGHFLGRIRRTNPRIATITSARLLYYTDALKSLLGTLTALLGQWCEPDFASAVGAENEIGGSRLLDFFR